MSENEQHSNGGWPPMFANETHYNGCCLPMHENDQHSNVFLLPTSEHEQHSKVLGFPSLNMSNTPMVLARILDPGSWIQDPPVVKNSEIN